MNIIKDYMVECQWTGEVEKWDALKTGTCEQVQTYTPECTQLELCIHDVVPPAPEHLELFLASLDIYSNTDFISVDDSTVIT